MAYEYLVPEKLGLYRSRGIRTLDDRLGVVPVTTGKGVLSGTCSAGGAGTFSFRSVVGSKTTGC